MDYRVQTWTIRGQTKMEWTPLMASTVGPTFVGDDVDALCDAARQNLVALPALIARS